MSKNKQAQVFHFDLYGKREEKYEFLKQQSIDSIPWTELEVREPNFFFVNKNFEGGFEYEQGFKVDELFRVNSVGIVTSKDAILINDFEDQLIKNVESHYKLVYDRELTKKIAYRVFDKKYVYYDIKIIDRARNVVMKHLLMPNLALITPKQAILGFQHVFISNTICDKNYLDSAGQFGAGNVFPLYLYGDKYQQTIGQVNERTPNLNPEIVEKISENLRIPFTTEKEQTPSTFAPIDILDYIYAVLYNLTYREKYKEFLKIDFPRVPYPKDPETFWKLVTLGGELRQIHLLESPKVNQFITTYPITGNNLVTKPRFESSESRNPSAHQLANS